MRRTFLLFGIMTMMAALLCASELNGKWAGGFEFDGRNVPLTFDFKTTGSVVTGRVSGLPTDNLEIKDGKLGADSVTFSVTTDYQGNPVKLICNGKISGDQIDFTMGTEDGGWSVSFTAKKST